VTRIRSNPNKSTESSGEAKSSSRRNPHDPARQKQIEALTAGLQKVSAQIEVSQPAPQMVNNP
jgi:hypothetical protein